MGLLNVINRALARRQFKRGLEAADAICNAAEQGDVKTLKHYFRNTPKGDANRIGDYALVAACMAGQVEAARYMLELGVPPAAAIHAGKTAESEALKGGHQAVLVLLHEYTVKAGLTPSQALADAAQKAETSRLRAIETEIVAKAPVLQRDINVREKPLKLKPRRP